MLRTIIHIDEKKCNGCGICADACHEGAIAMVDGKAKLVREDFCDGFGDCLPECPTGAISFEEREAPAYDEAAVKENQRKVRETQSMDAMHAAGGCPSARPMSFNRGEGTNAPASASMPGTASTNAAASPVADANAALATASVAPSSRLGQWPCQIKLMPTSAPYYDGAKLLIAADCTAYAYANTHEEFMKGKITIIGCPKLDAIDYAEKLTAIIRDNDIKSVTILRMEVPCCGGLPRAAETALQESGKFIPWNVVTISIDGRILD